MWVFGRGLGTSREVMRRGGRVVVGRGVMSWIGWRFMSFGPSEEGKEKGGVSLLGIRNVYFLSLSSM